MKRLLTAVGAISVLLAMLFLAADRNVNAQLPGGMKAADANAVASAIGKLPVVGSAMLVAAHPDDENSTLLPFLARGMHVRAAYLSLTRGDGGQNLIGTEQYEALGILRTDELLAARRIDGAEQYFGEEYDFGFSKSTEETMEKWGHNDALGDAVFVIRRFRPDILIARFTGTASDGHGNHSASGVLTREAFKAAADPTKFPEQFQQGVKPWQAARLYLNARSGGANAVSVQTDGFDPLYGKTFPEIGSVARSQHRSQGMGGGGGGRGNNMAYFMPLDAAVQGAPKNIFDGVDLTLSRFTSLSGGSKEVATRVESIVADIEEVQQSFSPYQPDASIPMLAHALRLLREVRTEIEKSAASPDAKYQATFLLNLKEKDFVDAISLAGGVRLDTLADKAEVVPGESFTITVSGSVRSPRLKAGTVKLKGPGGWTIAKSGDGEGAEAKFKVTAPTDAPYSQPYWLRKARTNDRFNVDPAPYNGDAENPPLFEGSFEFSAGEGANAISVVQTSGAINRFNDRIYGEREKPLAVVPPVGVWLEPSAVVFPSSNAVSQSMQVKVRSNRAAKQDGTVKLGLAQAWKADPASKNFSFSAVGDEASIKYSVSAPTGALKGASELLKVQAISELSGKNYSTGYDVIDYPHVMTRYLFYPAESKLARIDVKVAPGLKIGYVMGTGDQVNEALRVLGATVTDLTADDLAFGNLSRFDIVVTGIRAYEVRKDLVANQARLMDYVKNGGYVIAQYSRPQGVSDPVGPFPMSNGEQARVSVETVPVTILEPASPIFNTPNKITADDFKGWIQELGVYFMDKWAPEYTPLLAANDPGEPPQKGGMLLAKYGKGTYLYTGYVFNRQLPAGVPGAYRLMANMIGYGKSAAAKSAPAVKASAAK